MAPAVAWGVAADRTGPDRVGSRAAELGPDGRAAAARLRSGRPVRGTGTTGGEELETYHDRIREAVVARLAPGVKEHHHLRLGRALEASGGADPEALAVHFHAANDLEQAGGYYAAGPRRGVAGPDPGGPRSGVGTVERGLPGRSSHIDGHISSLDDAGISS